MTELHLTKLYITYLHNVYVTGHACVLIIVTSFKNQLSVCVTIEGRVNARAFTYSHQVCVVGMV